MSNKTRSERRLEIHKGIRNLQYDKQTVFVENFGSEESVNDHFFVKDNHCYFQKTEVLDMRSSRDPDIAVHDNFEGIVYPGALLKGNSGIVNGTPEAIMASRGPVTVYADFCTGENMRVENVEATESSIKAAIDKLISMFWARQRRGDIDIGANIVARERAYTSISEMAVGLNVDTNFLGINAKVNFDTSSTTKKVISVIDYTQPFFTIFVESHFTNRADYFGEDVTWDDLKAEGVNNNNPPVLVKSVTYGRRMYLFKEYDLTKSKTHSDEGVSYVNNSVKSAQDISETTECTDSWVYIRGGGATYGQAIYNSGTDSAKFRQLLQKCPTFTPDNPGKPLDYQLVFVKDNSPIFITRKGKYTRTSYAEYPSRVKVDVRSDCWGTGPTLDHLKVRFDFDTFVIKNGKRYPGKHHNMAPEWKLEQSDHKSGYLNLNAGEYVDGLVRVQVRRKWCGSWANRYVEYISPANGYIGVKCTGWFKHLNASFKTKP